MPNQLFISRDIPTRTDHGSGNISPKSCPRPAATRRLLCCHGGAAPFRRKKSTKERTIWPYDLPSSKFRPPPLPSPCAWGPSRLCLLSVGEVLWRPRKRAVCSRCPTNQSLPRCRSWRWSFPTTQTSLRRPSLVGKLLYWPEPWGKRRRCGTV